MAQHYDLRPDRREVTVDGQEVQLTMREFDLLEFLMRSPGVVFSRETLLQRVWGWDFDGGSRTVDVHVQTLRQILSQEGLSLPCLLIEDYPSLEIRGFMHDVTRSRVPSMESMKAMADWCSRYKLNHLELYVEHTYLFPQFSEMWRDDTPLTAEDILELDDYCASRGVELVPCIASFGHLFKLLRTKGYRRLSEFEDEDGSVYLVYGGGFIARMKDDMSGLAEEPVKPVLLDPDTIPSHHASTCLSRRGCKDIGREGAFLFKRNGTYYLTAADSYEGRYSSMVAMSESIYGPYRMRHEAVPCGGGTCYFKDRTGKWWCTFFGNDNQAPFREMPAIVPVDFAPNGTIHVIK